MVTLQPITSKNSPALPALALLVTQPFSIYPLGPDYQASLNALVQHILTIPLLPNRLPLPSVTQLSSSLPLINLHLLSIGNLLSISIESKVHLLANLLMFTPPRYPILPAPALKTYLALLTAIFNDIPPGGLEPPTAQKDTSWNVDSDSESEQHMLPAVASIPLDPKTFNRLATLSKNTHIASLLKALHGASLEISTFILGLTGVMPKAKDSIITTVLVHSGGAMIKELYRGYVRASPLGKEPNSAAPFRT